MTNYEWENYLNDERYDEEDDSRDVGMLLGFVIMILFVSFLTFGAIKSHSIEIDDIKINETTKKTFFKNDSCENYVFKNDKFLGENCFKGEVKYLVVFFETGVVKGVIQTVSPDKIQKIKEEYKLNDFDDVFSYAYFDDNKTYITTKTSKSGNVLIYGDTEFDEKFKLKTGGK